MKKIRTSVWSNQISVLKVKSNTLSVLKGLVLQKHVFIAGVLGTHSDKVENNIVRF